MLRVKLPIKCTFIALLLFLILGAGWSSAAQLSIDGASNFRVFAGLARGSLTAGNVAHVRADIEIQEIVKEIQKRIKDQINDFRIADLIRWSPEDDWRELSAHGYTHYLIATPSGAPPTNQGPAIKVTWTIGKISGGTQTFVGTLIGDLLISIPSDGEAEILQKRVHDGRDTWDSYRRDEYAQGMIDKFGAVFPEVNKSHTYFIECFANFTTRGNWQKAHSTMMISLSSSLESDNWHPSLTIQSDKEVEQLCEDLGHKRNADYFKTSDVLISGILSPSSGVSRGAKYIRTDVNIDGRARDLRKSYTYVIHQTDEEAALSRWNLTVTCPETMQLSREMMTAFAQHIKSTLRAPLPKSSMRWNCNARQ